MRFRNTLRATAGLQGVFRLTNLKALAGMAGFLFIFASILPAEVYQYTGAGYGTPTGSTYTTGEFVSGTFTFNDPLAGLLMAADVTSLVTSWTLFDGVNALSNSTAGALPTLSFTTDAMGNILDWSFEATYAGSSVDIVSQGASGSGDDTVTTGSDSATSTSAGTWQDTTPEPGTLGMMLAGSLLLFVNMRRRANKPIG